MDKPTWWPDNPYPESIFPMSSDRYIDIVSDPHTRTALSGCLGRLFWEIASKSIFDALQTAEEDGLDDDAFSRGFIAGRERAGGIKT